MSTALAVRSETNLDLESLQRVAKMLAVSGYFDAKGDMTTQIAQLGTKILAGAELGFGPFASVNGIHIISGRPSVGANLMATAVKNSPRYDYRVKEMSDAKCAIEFFEIVDGKRESIGVSIFTAEDARKAGTKNMDKFARNMLFARAMSNGVRWYCADVFRGNAVYVPEELGADVDDDGNIIDAPGEPITTSPAMPQKQAPDVSQASAGSGIDSDVDFGMGAKVQYAALVDRLSNGVAQMVSWAKQTHANSKGPATTGQYGYLSGRLDEIVDKKGAHNAILEVLIGRPVSSANPPGFDMARILLDNIVEGSERYKPEVVNNVRMIWGIILEAEGQASLFDPEAVTA